MDFSGDVGGELLEGSAIRSRPLGLVRGSSEAISLSWKFF
jgi:hypothetical protein